MGGLLQLKILKIELVIPTSLYLLLFLAFLA
jgi:hypothetical protein